MNMIFNLLIEETFDFISDGKDVDFHFIDTRLETQVIEEWHVEHICYKPNLTVN